MSSYSSEGNGPRRNNSADKHKKLNTLTFSIEDEQQMLAEAEKALGGKFDKKALLKNQLDLLKDEVGLVE